MNISRLANTDALDIPLSLGDKISFCKLMYSVWVIHAQTAFMLTSEESFV